MQVEPAQIVALAEIDPGAAQQGVGHGEVEVEVGNAVLMDAGMAIHPLAARPVGHVTAAGVLAVVCLQLALQIGDGLADMGAQIRHGFGIIAHGRQLAVAGGGHHGAGRITADQHLLGQRQHIDDQPIAEEVLHVELLRRGVGLGLGQTVIQIGQHLDELGGDIAIHEHSPSC